MIIHTLPLHNKGSVICLNINHMAQQGGKREGAGRPKKYGEETITLTFRVPESTKIAVMNAVKNAIEKSLTKKKYIAYYYYPNEVFDATFFASSLSEARTFAQNYKQHMGYKCRTRVIKKPQP